ncbi:hypothetical protein SDC9_144455 [bioreactor metagenome]|uniref:Uncharacterized protein n=1 Tax=bioreactor metagenome TaxID=1076179 RepID=A0A645E9H6_9ZZZZ
MVDVGRSRMTEARRVMVVEGPAAIGRDILELPLAAHVILSQQMVAQTAAALPFAGQKTDPVQRPVARAVIAAIFDVIPQSERHLQQLVPDAFGIPDRIAVAAEFEPPEIAARMKIMRPMSKLLLAETVRPLRRSEFDRFRHLPRLNEAAHAHGLAVRDFRLDRFAEFGPGLASHPEFGPGQRCQHTVSGTVGEPVGLNLVPKLRGRLITRHPEDPAAVHIGAQTGRIQKQFQIVLKPSHTVKYAVPDRIIGARIAPAVLQPQFLDQAAFQTAVSAADPHPDFAGGVAAQHRPVMHQQGLDPMPRRRHRSAQTGQTAADYAEFYPMLHRIHSDIPY